MKTRYAAIIPFLTISALTACGGTIAAPGTQPAAVAASMDSNEAGKVTGNVGGKPMTVKYASYAVVAVKEEADKLTGSALAVILSEEDICAAAEKGAKDSLKGPTIFFNLIRPKAETPGVGSYTYNQGAIIDDALLPAKDYGSVSGTAADVAGTSQSDIKGGAISGGSVVLTQLDAGGTAPVVGTFKVDVTGNPGLSGEFSAKHCKALETAFSISR